MGFGTERGWPAQGTQPYGLQRVVWTGEMPFEIHEMRARPDGFELTFTRPVDPASAGATSSYRLESYTYELHASYGSAEMDKLELEVAAAEVAADGLSVRLRIEGLRSGYVHELHSEGVRAAEGDLPLLHADAYYTLIEIPERD